MSPNFYRRELPQTCVSFGSKEGRQIFQSSLIHKGLKSFYSLIEQHTTQSEPAYCGPSTLVIVLNALAVDPRRKWKGPWRWYDEYMLNCCIDLEEVKTTGITLKTFICLAKCQGVSVRGYYALECAIDQFRDAIRESCIENDDNSNANNDQSAFLVVSYNRGVLKQTGEGHFSPIAAYDPISDSVLILDTARFKYGAHWVNVPLLFESMQKIDPDTNKSRGFVLLSHNQSKDLLESILFRTKQSHNLLWQEYEKYLLSLSSTPTLDDAYSYWTQQGNNPFYVSELLMPQYIPVDSEGKKQIKEVTTLLSTLIKNYKNLTDLQSYEMDRHCSSLKEEKLICEENNNCGTTTITIGCAESIFIIYLASFKNVDDRLSIIKSNLVDGEIDIDNISNGYSLNQILAEAELVRLAMEANRSFEY